MLALLKRIFLSILAIILIFEEWLWNVLTAFGRRLTRFLHLEGVEEWLRQAPPKVAMAAFLVPLLIVAPINGIAIWFFACGHILQGTLMEIFAKLLGTFLVARVFALTKAQLLTFRWFFVVYTTITGWLHWAHDRITQTAVYKALKQIKATLKELKKRFFT